MIINQIVIIVSVSTGRSSPNVLPLTRVGIHCARGSIGLKGLFDSFDKIQLSKERYAGTIRGSALSSK
jgi:hypothetical protein